MQIALDAAYAIAAAATAPWWMRKSRAGWGERFGRGESLPQKRSPRILLHAVSVGEVNLTGPLIDLLAPRFEVVLSATTDTGIARARELHGARPGLHVVRYPLDASWSVRRFLDRVAPDAAALVELELWPNFVAECSRRRIPVAVINGRLSERSFRRYRFAAPVLGRTFRSLEFAAVQDEDYAARFRAMGVGPERCIVAGSMKWDSAPAPGAVKGAEDLARDLGIDRSRPLIVAGSTAPGEHELLHRAAPPGVQLLCAPRKPEWFDQAAEALPGCVRRSSGARSSAAEASRFLLDSIGELRKAYTLADVVVIGRSFGDLFGSDPMEPAALGKPIVIGPAVDDFRTVVNTMLRDQAIIQAQAEDLPTILARLIDDPDESAALGRRALDCVKRHRGAAARHAALLTRLLERAPQNSARAPKPS